MYSIKQQRGMATLLLVLLVGITVMVITVGVAKNVGGQKETTVAAHAQTNAQMMAWAGVSAFQDFVKAEGAKGISFVKALDGTDKTLKSGSQEIIAKNIQVIGCDTTVKTGDHCTVSADISANNASAKAATTVNVSIDMVVQDTTATTTVTNSVMTLGGNTILTGALITAESPNTNLTLNTTGKFEFNVGASITNIANLTINSTGDIRIDCGVLPNNCGTTKININTTGKVTVSGGDNNFGVINAGDNVALNAGAEAETIITGGSAYLTSSNVSGNVESQSFVWLTDSTVSGNVKSYNYLVLDTNSTIQGDAYVNGNTTVDGINTVRLSTSRIVGTVYAKGNIYPMGGTEKVGNAYITGDVFPNSTVIGTRQEKLSLTATPLKDVLPVTVTVANQSTSSSLGAHVDVTKYLSEANYIFTANGMVDRVFLNKIKSKDTNITYYYEGNKQIARDNNGASVTLPTSVVSGGFYLGFYKIGSNTYRGAVCDTINTSNICTSNIIGFLPRVSVSLNTANKFWLAAEDNAPIGKSNKGATDDYSYAYFGLDPNATGWRIRTLVTPATMENAMLAPGIMYFQGNVSLSSGTTGLYSNAINTFLAEGTITANAYSPILYSPYNAIRNGGTVDLVCNRSLKNTNDVIVDKSATTPITLSNTYLFPTNLCKDDNNFAYSMDKQADGVTLDTVTIDNVSVPKLDLGRVALMANKDINIGSCANIYGDVLTRGYLDVSSTGSCGTIGTPLAQQIVGQVSVQAESNKLIPPNNDFSAGMRLVAPAAGPSSSSTSTPSGVPKLIIDTNSVLLKWTKVL